jgi:hypothetical protein
MIVVYLLNRGLGDLLCLNMGFLGMKVERGHKPGSVTANPQITKSSDPQNH